MLTPEQMDDAGDLVANVYRQIEAEMLQYLTRRMIEGDVTGQRSQTAILLLAQSSAIELQRIIAEHADEIDEAVIEEVEEAIGKSDRQDVAKIERGMGVTLPMDTRTVQTAATVAGVRQIIERDNVDMNNAARSSFFQWSSWGITQVNTGAMTADQALHKAVRELSRRGLNITEISYRDPETGAHTITNHVDVAVKRHIRTQIGQDAARLTEKRLDEGGCEFVEVSSHCGARPSHREWHGKVYHRGGDTVYNGEHFEDFHYGTGYERVRGPYTSLADCLLGVNCRHSFGPWIPGTPRAYDEDPKHPSGLSNEELYDLTQRQRARERDIRATKREIAAAQQVYEASPTPANQVEVSKLQQRLRNQQAGMRQFIKEANAKGKPGTTVLTRQPHREWAGDMPKAGSPGAPANRSLEKFMGMPSVKQQIKAAGVSQAAVRRQIANGLAGDGLDARGFRWNTIRQQRDRLVDAIAAAKAERDGTAKAAKGKHAQMQPVDDLHPQRVAGAIRTKEAMTFDQADGSRANPGYNPQKIGPHEKNCQASVLAHEARRRGYDVQARGYDKDNAAMFALAAEPYMAYHEPGDTAAVAQKIKPAEAPTFARFHKMCEETIRQGERYQMRFTDGSTGHVVCIDRNDAGELRIHDPQSGDTHVGKKAREYLKRIKYRSKSYGMDVYEDNYIYRVDDKALNSKIADEVLEPRQ